MKHLSLLAMIAASLYVSKSAGNVAEVPDISAKWTFECEKPGHEKAIAPMRTFTVGNMRSGLAAIQRINPELEHFIQYRFGITNVKVSCKNEHPLFKSVSNGIGFFALAVADGPRSTTIFSPRLFSYVVNQIEHLGPRDFSEALEFEEVPSSTFHELLHIARIDNLPASTHNMIMSHPHAAGKRRSDDVVYACADMAYPVPVSERSIVDVKERINFDLRAATGNAWMRSCVTCALAIPPENYDAPDVRFDIRALFGPIDLPRFVTLARDRKTNMMARESCATLYEEIKASLFTVR